MAQYAPPTAEELAQIKQIKQANGGQRFAPPTPEELRAIRQTPATSAGETFRDQFGNAATMGYLPEISAATEKGINYIARNLPESLKPEWVKVDEEMKAKGFTLPEEKKYAELRDEKAKRLKLQEEEHPTAAIAGSLSAIAPTLLATAPAAAAGLTGRLMQAGKVGAIQGGLYNPGSEEGEIDPLQLRDRMTNAVGSGLFGTLLQGGGEAISKVAPTLAQKAKEFAEARGFSSLGPYARDAMKAGKREGGQLGIGRAAIDEGLVGWLPKSEGKMRDIAQSKANEVGKDIGGMIDSFQEQLMKVRGEGAGNMPALPGQAARGVDAGINRELIAKKLEEQLLADSGEKIFQSQNEKFKNLIDDFRSGPKNLDIKEAQKLKNELNKRIKWDRLPGTEIPDNEQFLRALYSNVGQGLEDAGSVFAEKLGQGKEYEALKKRYGNLKEMAAIAGKRSDKDAANRFISPSDYAAGLGGMIYSQAQNQDPMTSAFTIGGMAAANRLGRKFGAPLVTMAMDKVANGLQKMPGMAKLATDNPEKFASVVQRMAEQYLEMSAPTPGAEVPQAPIAPVPNQGLKFKR